MFKPVDENFSTKNKQAVWRKSPKAILSPTILFHCLYYNYKKEGEEVEPFPHIGTRHLEQITPVELLEHTAFEFHKVVAHHDG